MGSGLQRNLQENDDFDLHNFYQFSCILLCMTFLLEKVDKLDSSNVLFLDNLDERVNTLGIGGGKRGKDLIFGSFE